MDVEVEITAEGEAISGIIVLPLTAALAYGPPMIKTALEAGHTVTIRPRA